MRWKIRLHSALIYQVCACVFFICVRASFILGCMLLFWFFFHTDQGSDELWSRFESMSKVVISLHTEEELMNGTFLTVPGAVESICRLQTRFEALPGYGQLCSKASLTDVNSACCPIWSLASFITSIVNKTSCHQVRLFSSTHNPFWIAAAALLSIC